MKEATGEANMTVLTVVLIGVVLAIGYVLITNVMENMANKTGCLDAGGIWKNNGCYGQDGTTISYTKTNAK